MYPDAEAFALPPIGSDHSPILLSLDVEKVKRKKAFKLEAFWLVREECGRILRDIWETTNLEAGDLAVRLKKVAIELTKWIKKAFPNSKKRIDELKNGVQVLMNSQSLWIDRNREQILKREIDDLGRQ